MRTQTFKAGARRQTTRAGGWTSLITMRMANGAWHAMRSIPFSPFTRGEPAMTRSIGRTIALALALTLGTGCARETHSGAPARAQSYLYVFAGDDDRRAGHSDFLAVIDADP